MIRYKTDEEIQLIRNSAKVLAQVHGEIAKRVRPGVKTKELDKLAEEFILDHGGTPSFKNYHGFPAALCISVNEVVVHGFPGEYEVKPTDVVSIDCGVKLNGYHSDSAYTYPLEGVTTEVLTLLQRTYDSLLIGIEQARVGNRMGDVSFAIQHYVEQFGYGVVRELVGHGVGKDLHESPDVPNFGKRGKGVKLAPGMVFAIEPMINMGTRKVVQERDGWTIRTQDRKPSAHFEHTIAIHKDKTEVITTHEYIEQNYSFKWRNKSR
ncbi:MAG: type I methionyl aminopeptidase [Cyclobacteriaceae bacterium]|nr:type I methionyl aminopeptidase [Cytophagales bacterium]MBX2900570.1 type I methionyl aminopeptidase [Cyclobacteriaceae bacterium]